MRRRSFLLGAGQATSQERAPALGRARRSTGTRIHSQGKERTLQYPLSSRSQSFAIGRKPDPCGMFLWLISAPSIHSRISASLIVNLDCITVGVGHWRVTGPNIARNASL